MFEKNGVIYAGEPTPGLRVAGARVVNDGSMLITFSTGETRLFDVAELADIPVFAPLTHQDVFEAYAIDHGVLTWADGAIDIAPEALYEHSYAYPMTA